MPPSVLPDLINHERAAVMPHRRVKNAWIGRVHDEVGGTGFRAYAQHMFPGLSTIGASKYTALITGTPDLALHGNQYRVGVGWVNLDAGDLPGFFQPDMGPGFASIGGLPHAVAMRGGDATDGGFTGAHVDDIFIRRRNCNRADGTHLEVTIRDVLPGRTRVDGFPHATTGCSHVIQVRLSDHARYRCDAPTTPGTHETILKCAKRFV